MNWIYCIRVRGQLGLEWGEWFAGFQVINQPEGETVFVGPVPDQAALHGILARLRDLNLVLMEVSLVEEKPYEPTDHGSTICSERPAHIPLAKPG